MLHLDSLRLRNYALFREQDFHFEEGLTVIGGNNRVGKSLLLSALRPLFHGLASGERLPKGSHIELDMRRTTTENKPKTLRIVADSPKVKPDWQLFVDRRDMATHRKADARRLIDQAIPITEDLFDCTCHLSIKPDKLPLFGGTPANRLDWLSSAFNLAALYNNMTDKVDSLLGDLVKDEVRLQTLQETLLPIPEKPNKTEFAKLQRRYKDIQQDIAAWSDIQRMQEEYSNLRALYKTLQQRRTNITSKEELQESLIKMQRLVDTERDWQDYDNNIQEYQKLTANKQRLLESLPEKLVPKNRGAAKDALRDLQKQLDNIQEQLRQAESIAVDYQAQQDAKRQLRNWRQPKRTKYECQKLQRSYSDKLAYINGALQNLEAASQDGICPHCSTKITKQHVQSVRKQYHRQRQQVEDRLQVMEEALTWYELKHTARQGIKPIDVAGLEEQQQRYRKYLRTLSELLDLPAVSKPVKPEHTRQKLAKAKRRLADLQHDLVIFNSHSKDTLPDKQDLGDRLRELQQQIGKADANYIAELSQQAVRIGERLQSMRLQMRSYKHAVEHNANLSSQVADLEKRCQRIRPLKALKEAFGRGGLLLHSMQEAIEHLLQEINALVPLLLDEQFRVDIVTGPRKLDVLIERNGEVNNLRTTSTSEQRCWALLFAAAMLRILPNRMLVDTIILDELESNMDAKSRARYAKEYLPFLQTVVPKVIVVTPLISGEMQFTPDRVYRVVKQQQVSRLEAV